MTSSIALASDAENKRPIIVGMICWWAV